MKHYDDRKWVLSFPLGALLIIIMQLLFYLQMFSLLPKFVFIACDVFDINQSEFDLFLNSVVMLSLFAPIIVSVFVESEGVGKYRMACILGVLYYFGVTFILIVLILEQYKHFNDRIIIIILSIGMVATMMTSMAYSIVMDTLGAEQMKMPDEEKNFMEYFAVLYSSRAIAIIVSIVVGDNPNVSLMQIMGMIYSLMTITLVLLVSSKDIFIKRINDGNYLIELFEELLQFCVTCKVKRAEDVDYTKRASLAQNEKEARILQRYREEKTIEHYLRLLIPIFIYLLLNSVYSYIVHRQGDRMNRTLSKSHMIYFDRRTMDTIEPALKLSISYLNRFILYPFFHQRGVNSGLRRLMLALFVQCVAFHVALILQLVLDIIKFKLSILYQLPQYFIFSWSDSIFYVGAMIHAYMQAPITMRTFSISLYLILIPLSQALIDYFEFLENKFFYVHDQTIPFAIITLISVWNMYLMLKTLKTYTFEVFHDVEYTNY